MKFIVPAFLFLLVSCNNSTNQAGSTTKAAESKSDSLMHEVLKQHDIGMAKMSKINETKSRIQHVIDSVSKLQGEVGRSSEQYRNQLDSALNMLILADRDMETWMNEFNMDSLNDNKEAQAKYFESEKEKISKVNEAMISSLQKADSLLKR